MIVEDHEDCRRLIRIVLTRKGFDVIEVATGLEALGFAAWNTPDLIVMDLGLPDVAGDEVISRLKADRRTEKIPVIVTTGHMSAEVTRRTLGAGAAKILLKPYGIEELMRIIEQYLLAEPVAVVPNGIESTSHPE